ncbi:protein kinase [Erwiniaceae bacterium BAC15a-03b]|uniref:Protein kinase n=1 Tax=Winslowiella arboricola TaxID=2978220 RepID=A0A9J6PLI1_9GAMM|nr:serine/threonine-protein kinase [Winslowiella arboricola]MCU5771707.1 protein kinase [Winslowiella arboricola]MCU5777622.1 protein kinase [Winslowiella arboricola]
MSEMDNKKSLPNALPVGYRFNEFEIKEVIGGGGFGIVYRAWDHQLERTIAIKEFMPSSLAVRSEDLNLVLRSERFSKTFHAGLNSFIQEARLLARFNHPNMLHVLRFWVQNDTAYMCTQFYSGTTLSTMAAERPESISEAFIRGDLLPPLIGAIRLIHNEGYLHRDISLDNIQIQANMRPVLLDFGSARKAIGNMSDETETMLKPGFAPIEQYSDGDENEQGAWTDIYALGAVLHTLITGAPPAVSVVRSIEDSYVPLTQRRPAGYSLALLQAIDKMLSLYPADRPQDMDQLAGLLQLTDADINESLLARPGGPGTMLVPVKSEEEAAPEAAKPVTARRWLLPALVAAGVLVGIGIGALVVGGGDEPASGASNAPAATQESAPQNAPAADSAPTASETPAAQPSVAPPPPPPEPVAQVYLKLRQGDELTLNGQDQAVVPSVNGFASLQLPPGEYQIVITNHGQQRQQKITVGEEGVWIINPQ